MFCQFQAGVAYKSVAYKKQRVARNSKQIVGKQKSKLVDEILVETINYGIFSVNLKINHCCKL